ncbi:acyl carrier protein [Kitasatospora sp. NPDC001574]
MVCAAFADVLGRQEVGADDSFFDLGGHSMLMVRLQDRLDGSAGVRLPIADFFTHPTAADLAGLLRERAARPAGP